MSTVWYVLRRAGFTARQPICRAAERDEQAIEHWRRYQWPAAVDGSQGDRGVQLCPTWDPRTADAVHPDDGRGDRPFR
jgi:hypothetical protein